MTEFLSGFGDNSLEEGEEATGNIKFTGAKGGSSGFFIRDCKDGHYGLGFGLLIIMFLADVVIKIQQQEFYGLMIIMDFEVITAIDDGVASVFFPAWEILEISL